MHNIIIENPLTPGHRIRNRKSRCTADAMLNQDRILQLRDMDIAWPHIAAIMKMSTGSLRKAIKQISALKPDSEFEKPNAIRPKLIMYFTDETAKKKFIKWARAIQNGEELPDEE